MSVVEEDDDLARIVCASGSRIELVEVIRHG